MLIVEGICKRFGGLQALSECFANVERNKIIALIGPNGSGKTTLFHCITGVYKPDGGKVIFDGEDITGLRPHEVAQKGLVRTFQITRVFRTLTVLDNLLVSPAGQKGEKVSNVFTRGRIIRQQERDNTNKAIELLTMLELVSSKDELAGNLSYGEQKKLEIARALMIDPKILLLDEPAAGVSTEAMNTMVRLIREINKNLGTTFFLVEHRMNFVLSLAEHIYVLEGGRNLVDGTPHDVVHNPKVIEAYLGTRKTLDTSKSIGR